MFLKIILLKKFASFTGKHLSESSLIKLQVFRNVTLLKRYSNTGFLLWILWIIQEHLFCRWLWRAGTETPVRLFKNTFFYRASPVAASDDSFRFPACNFTKKLTPDSRLQLYLTPEKTLFCEFSKIFKNIFCQTPPDDCFLFLSVNFEKFSRSPLL